MTKRVVKLLKKAKALLEPRGAWTRGDYARNKDGIGVEPTSRQAKCWCAVGALAKASGSRIGWEGPTLSRAQDALWHAAGRRFVPRWQDMPSRRKSDVLALFDRAIATEDASS